MQSLEEAISQWYTFSPVYYLIIKYVFCRKNSTPIFIFLLSNAMKILLLVEVHPDNSLSPTKKTYFLFMASIFQIIFVNDEYCGVVLEHVWFEDVLVSWETTLYTKESHTPMYISSILICIYDTLSNSTYVRDIN